MNFFHIACPACPACGGPGDLSYKAICTVCDDKGDVSFRSIASQTEPISGRSLAAQNRCDYCLKVGHLEVSCHLKIKDILKQNRCDPVPRRERPPLRCAFCNRHGHIESKCWLKKAEMTPLVDIEAQRERRASRDRGLVSRLRCDHCGKSGHMAATCFLKMAKKADQRARSRSRTRRKQDRLSRNRREPERLPRRTSSSSKCEFCGRFGHSIVSCYLKMSVRRSSRPRSDPRVHAQQIECLD